MIVFVCPIARVDSSNKPACELCGRRLSTVKHHRAHGVGRARHTQCKISNRTISSVAISSESTPPIPKLFDSHIGNHDPLLPIQRSAIVVLNKDHQSRSVIASKVGTSLPTVRRWIRNYDEKRMSRTNIDRVDHDVPMMRWILLSLVL